MTPSRDAGAPTTAGAGAPTPGFSFAVHASAGRPHAAYLARHIRQAHALVNPPLRDLSLALVGDARMSGLHEQFMGIPGPTDVLTFELEHDRRGRVTAGEVIVCVPEARRQARLRGTLARQELLLYALHGMLHLCGFDDRTARGFRKMHRTEDDILTRLGIGPIFARGPCRSRADRAGTGGI